MRRAGDVLRGGRRPRVIYTDLDGTLLGPGGSLFAGPEGGVSNAAANALVALYEAGIDVVPVSGRTAEQVWEVARAIGASDFVAEMGGILSLDRDAERIRQDGAYRGAATPHEAMVEAGAPGMLLEAFPRRLEPHAPWAFLPRVTSMLFRGYLETREAEAALEEAGYGWLTLLDNGVIPRSFPRLDVEEVHAYHLLPRGVTKATGVGAHVDRRGLDPEECLAVGDSLSDAALTETVGNVVIVANGWEAVEASGRAPGGLLATEASYGEGFAEVVAEVLS
ncbi:MAG TPA: HAD hydrolase family protein [Actinomycetota bacterium]